ncbi:helix-turn-helix domain-containing protein [Paracoccus benzoatiresistens]|uniref:Helix-turn-helix domain-containing protein n=1 Tax=Paracoccus benzoatiresistens TaxID=2997341 RepID=A0ABT4J431_9RHOB|nr:helix-turn-helix domain-containing protein [Paracoccus sp. EF6]MCZ0961878.1 helix-turn-helix domain-containing protein [Paracoccus sp. EF6]
MQIPIFSLFGETEAFPDVVHCERIWDRARLHDWVIAPHRHRDMAQLFVMRRGSAEVCIDGETEMMRDGEFLFLPAGFVHGFKFGMGSEGLVLSFPLSILSGVASAFGDMAHHLSRPFRRRAGERVAELAGQIHHAFRDPGHFRAGLLVALSQALLISVAEIAARGGQAAEPLARRRMLEFERLIAQNMDKGWGTADYASALAVTPGHLSRICRMATGQGASRHIETVLMTEARRLLAFTRLHVAEVGYRLGFDDPPYFSRRFRLATGETPSAYRARFNG